MIPFRVGNVLGYCLKCRSAAIISDDGASAIIAHLVHCPELTRLARELCRQCGSPVKLLCQGSTGFCSPRCEQRWRGAQTGDTPSHVATRVAD